VLPCPLFLVATVFIFHGIGGNPDENWFPWIAAELTKAGHAVRIPHFPHAGHPELREWIEHFEQYKPLLNAETILVGHSLGSTFALRLLERSPQPVRATFLVAPVWSIMGNKFDPLITSFTAPPYHWENIRKNAGTIHVINADNDPYITLEKAQALAANLGRSVTLIRNGGHFNTEAGFMEFPQLLRMIQEGSAHYPSGR